MAILGIHVSFQGVYILKTIHSPLREMLVTTFQSPSCHQKAPKLPVETSSLWPKKLGIIQLNLSITLLCQEPLHGCAPNHFEGPRLAVTIRNYDPSWMNSILQYDLNVSSFFFFVCVCVFLFVGESPTRSFCKKKMHRTLRAKMSFSQSDGSVETTVSLGSGGSGMKCSGLGAWW